MIRKILTILLITVIASAVFASNGTQIGTVGARATAMGSNFRGLADDWSAVYFNPAGLTQLNSKINIGLSGGLIMPRGSYQADPYPVYPFSGMDLGEVDATPKDFLVPAFGIFYKASEKMTVGLGVYAPFGLGTEWDLVDIPNSYGNLQGLSKDKETYSDHQVINIQPTIAYKLSDKISIGLGVSYIWGKMDLDMVKLAYNPVMAQWPTLQQGIAILPDLTDDQCRIPVENNLTGTGSAYGFNFGLLFDLSEKLSIGISGRYCTDLKLKGDNTRTMYMPGDATITTILNAVPAENLGGDNAKASLLYAFSGQSLETEMEDIEADLPLPMTIGAGIAYKASPEFTLTADVSWTNWATWDVITVTVPDGEDIPLEQNWEDTFEFGAGFEYAKNGVAFRGGYYTVATPAPDETMSPTIIDPIRRHVATCGFGYKMNNITFNLAVEAVMFANKTVSEYNINAENGTMENYAGYYKFNAWVITLGTSIDL